MDITDGELNQRGMRTRRRRENPQCSVACNYCRVKKARCSGAQPCSNCETHRQVCTFPAAGQRSTKRRNATLQLEERLNRMEERLQRVSSRSAERQGHPVWSPVGTGTEAENDYGLEDDPLISEPLLTPSTSAGTGHDVENIHSDTAGEYRPNQPRRESAAFAGTPVSCGRELPGDNPQPGVALAEPRSVSVAGSASFLRNQAPVSSGFDPLSQAQARGASAALAPSQLQAQANSFIAATDDASRYTHRPWYTAFVNSEPKGSIEHHGISSYLSICSKSGIDWISHRLGSSAFQSGARKFAALVNKSLKLERRFSTERVPEPSRATAWRWVTAFFDESFEHSLGLVQRPWFEARLESHFSSGAGSRDDFVWYALLNTVYAIGCRIQMSQDGSPRAYVAAREQSWRYFENAMSVHSELLYMPTDSTAVEAVILMAYYSEALASPSLEYMLVSVAIRLAQSKGFHVQMPPGSSISEEDINTRAWLWWCAYIFDKHISLRSGRPSSVDDSEISVSIPTASRAGTPANIDFFTAAAKHAQISSQVSRRLSMARIPHISIEELLQTIRELDGQLREWYSALDPIFKSRLTSRSRKSCPDLQSEHFAYLNFSYHGTLCTIHSIITYPWVQPALLQTQQHAVLAQVEESSSIVSEASRAIAIATQQIDFDATSPIWLAFYYPVLSLITLFINVLHKLTVPGNQSVASDLTLLDVLAGHFSRLEYATASGITIGFAKELANLARKAYIEGRDLDLPRPAPNSRLAPAVDNALYSTMLLDPPGSGEFNDLEPSYLAGVEWPFLFPALNDATLD